MVPKSGMNNRNQMNGLYPIIRRVRRPLMPVDDHPVGHPADAKPAVAAVEEGHEAPVTADAGRGQKESDDRTGAIEQRE